MEPRYGLPKRVMLSMGCDGNDPMCTHLQCVFPKREVTESHSETPGCARTLDTSSSGILTTFLRDPGYCSILQMRTLTLGKIR